MVVGMKFFRQKRIHCGMNTNLSIAVVGTQFTEGALPNKYMWVAQVAGI